MTKTISAIIPVYKETKTIHRNLSHLSSLCCFEALEIIIVDGELNRSTLSTISQEGIIKIPGPKGRGAQMNQGATIATGNILLFLHADTLLPNNALKSILNATSSKRIVGGAFNLGIEAKGIPFRLIEAAVRMRTYLTRIPYGDQAFFIKKWVFFEVGGFPDIPIMEDVALLQKIKEKGHKIMFINSPVKTSARRWEKEGLLYCTLRNWLLAFLYYAGVSPVKLSRFYPTEEGSTL